MDNVNGISNNGGRNLYTAWRSLNSVMAGIFSVVITAVFPLVYGDFYFDILNYKTMFYYTAVVIFAVVFIIVNAALIYLDRYLHRRGLNLTWWDLRASDWAMLLFLAAAVISTFQSEYFEASLWGSEGRFSGLILIAAYAFTYFAVSRSLRLKQWYLDLFLAAGMLACVMGILQFFRFDPLGFKREMDPGQYTMFTSTIGNINTYTSYVAMITGMSALLFYLEHGRGKKAWYLSCYAISLFALITGISDNAYLAILALVMVFPLFALRNIKGARTYSLLLAVLGSEFWLINWIICRYPGSTLKISGLFQVISGSPWLNWAVPVLWLLFAGLWAAERSLPRDHALMKKRSIGIWIWLMVLAVFMCAGIFALYDVNVLGNAGRYGSLADYLYINDDWGTHRWYIWRIGMESYGQFPLMHKLFGFGPDTYGIVTSLNYYDEMAGRYGEIFDSAHNEYLQYLVTLGLVGLTSYLALMVSAVREMVHRAKKEPFVMAVVFAVVCYGAQAVVNISVPIVTPVMLTLLMMGVSIQD